MGILGNILRAAKAHIGERIREEYEREIRPIRNLRNIRKTLRDTVEREVRETGTFGEELLGPAPMYNPGILYNGSRKDYVDDNDKKLKYYDFNYHYPLPKDPDHRITKFPISVYVPKGKEKNLRNIIAAELKRLTDSKNILDFEQLWEVGTVEALAYEVTGGEARPKKRNPFVIFGNDVDKYARKLFSMKPVKPREPKAAGATYTILITPMIPKDGHGYTPPGGNGGHAPGNGHPI